MREKENKKSYTKSVAKERGGERQRQSANEKAESDRWSKERGGEGSRVLN